MSSTFLEIKLGEVSLGARRFKYRRMDVLGSCRLAHDGSRNRSRIAMMTALSLVGVLLASTAVGAGTLSGKMAIYDDLLGARWTCTIGATTYFATYTVEQGNTLHGHLYSKDSSEDAYYGYDAKRKLYWSASADSTGATESQTSVDGMTFVGTLNAGGTTSKATNIFMINSAHKWVVRARGSAGGNPYNVTATCLR